MKRPWGNQSVFIMKRKILKAKLSLAMYTSKKAKTFNTTFGRSEKKTIGVKITMYFTSLLYIHTTWMFIG